MIFGARALNLRVRVLYVCGVLYHRHNEITHACLSVSLTHVHKVVQS